MHYLFSDQASTTTLYAARRAITAPLAPKLGGWAEYYLTWLLRLTSSEAGCHQLLDIAPTAHLAYKLGG
ncbi:hypothetical protein C2845_PM17G05810 [Panicum miliaceum]|uniref:Uncharacterized protein n=1 Tax=Panicum miliaceum TaxID=4540 RepID=A0A3L6Q1S6_PANMI|nr:hypothetical protein C2845_PM17G05810 [Panicum miliaceum]